MDKLSARRRQDDGEDEEDDYMSMAFVEESQSKRETFTQKKLRKLREAEEKARVPSKAELAAAEAARREAALAKSTLDASNKGFKMMAKLGYKPGSALGRQNPGGSESDEPDQRLREPLWVSVKENRGGIGLDSEKKRKLREEFEGEARRDKAVESDFVERVRAEREEKRQEGQFQAAQRVIERLEDTDSSGKQDRPAPGSGSEEQEKKIRPKARVNVLYRGLVREREAALREKQAARRRSQIYSEKDPKLPSLADDDELEADDRLALGRTAEGEVVEVEADEDEEDEELAAFEALSVQERLNRAVAYLRGEYNYCFWCKFRYESAAMEGCPGLTEEDHD
ncbi:G-patch domain-containing protein [Trichophyton tonsurans CBS 112818]|uniref:G-patch domain-containing protein n=2 Tax=Trichophyton TaxID=5550 RepID=F2RXI1_TRIT1|nr:G-patch domain-containing protein [Trichophyton tonsurans CBS 112818]